MSKMRTFAVLSHTHWDREWYLPYQELRLKLVDLVDHLLAILTADPDYRHFMLDGQTVVLEDYLELRPCRREALRDLICAGRVLVGPWYVLPDEFLVSGESLVRNLLMGRDMASSFGAVMNVGYLPDQFGHIGQMPQILAGFEMDAAVIWRGVGDEVKTSELTWRAPDGSAVLALHLPLGYFNLPVMPETPAELVEQLRALRQRLESYATTGLLIVMNGCDHGYPQASTPEMIARANALMDDAEVEQTTLPKVVTELRRAIAAEGLTLPVATGELRDSRRAHLLPGVLSARTWIKQREARCEGLLEHWTEPFTAWARLLGRTEDPRPSLRLAWQQLLRNQPHDSVCGCSVDEVHDEMRTRFAAVEEIGSALTRDALGAIAAEVDTLSARGGLADSNGATAEGDARSRTPLLVFNPGAGPRTDFVSLPVWLPRAGGYRLTDEEGRDVPDQLVSDDEGDPLSGGINRALLQDALSQLRADYVADPARRLARIGFVAQDVPSFGYRTYVLKEEKAGGPATGSTSDDRPRAAAIAPNAIANEFYVVEVEPREGTATVTDRASGRRWEGLNRFEDSGDAGDEYNLDAPESDRVIGGPATPPTVTVVESGPARATLRVSGELGLPRGLAADRRARSKDYVTCPFRVEFSLIGGVKRVAIRTEVENRATDHRLRVHFPTGVAADTVTAETQFGVVSRAVGARGGGADGVEQPVPTQPQRGFVHVGESEGFLLVNRGLPEYEAIPTATGVELALTLLRCVGWLSRDDLRSRVGHAGPPLPTPGAQNPGWQVFEYAIVPGAAGWPEEIRGAHWFGQPLAATSAGWHTGGLPLSHGLLEIAPEALVVSAVKLPEHGDGLIVRLYNPTETTLTALVKLALPFLEVAATNLAETARMPLASDKRTLRLEIAAAQIATLRFSFA